MKAQNLKYEYKAQSVDLKMGLVDKIFNVCFWSILKNLRDKNENKEDRAQKSGLKF